MKGTVLCTRCWRLQCAAQLAAALQVPGDSTAVVSVSQKEAPGDTISFLNCLLGLGRLHYWTS